MNRQRIQKLLDEYYLDSFGERNLAMIELLEALLDSDYDPDLGKSESSSL
jgi:hypothetical protein